MSELRIEDCPPDIQWLLIIERFGSIEKFAAWMVWRGLRVEATPERVAVAIEVLTEDIAEKSEHLPTEERLAELREYRANGNRWTQQQPDA
jgi:hypothetical protein